MYIYKLGITLYLFMKLILLQKLIHWLSEPSLVPLYRMFGTPLLLMGYKIVGNRCSVLMRFLLWISTPPKYLSPYILFYFFVFDRNPKAEAATHPHPPLWWLKEQNLLFQEREYLGWVKVGKLALLICLQRSRHLTRIYTPLFFYY